MKYLTIIIILGLSLNANEIDRMESMVNDIENLRYNYSKCKKELDKQIVDNIIPRIDVRNSMKKETRTKNKIIAKYKKRLDKQIFKNTILRAEIDSLRKTNKQDNSTKLVNNLKNILKIKENEIYNLERKIVQLNKNKQNSENNLVLAKKEAKVYVKENQFPKLVMKDSVKEKKTKSAKKIIVKKEIPKNTKVIKKNVETIREVPAATFRLDADTDIYNGLNGKVIYNWTEGTSFTSYLMTENWIKITGHFQRGKWSSSRERLWVKKENMTKR